MLRVTTEKNPIAPLDIITISGAKPGSLAVFDSDGTEYFRTAAAEQVPVQVSGAAGSQIVFNLGENNEILDSTSFKVHARTWVSDEGGRIEHLLDMLYFTMISWGEGDRVSRVNGKYYTYFVRWLRDHVHTLKGMKYFAGDIKSAIELYADYQQPNGMIWDLLHPGVPYQMWRDHTFKKGQFIQWVENGEKRFQRIPVEMDVEFLFIEGLYYTWKATGDTEWMAGLLDKAIKAYEYDTTDRYRWSEKYQLLKRGYTIDTWDFMSSYDTHQLGGDNVVDPDKNVMGIMHGDNTGMAMSCRYLAEMLEKVGRNEEAELFRKRSAGLLERLNKIAWNGEFFQHHVSEDPSFKRDLGVDETRQVSLSNAYALNRGITHEQCVAIIKTYQRIREEMPKSSPGEFYHIYPPFEKGFKNKWHYMNGGVGTIVAGELAHGAFEHGFENYGFDILDRVTAWGDKHNGYLNCSFRGCQPEQVESGFSFIDTRPFANCDTRGNSDPNAEVTGWMKDDNNDLREFPLKKQEILTIPFDVPNREENNNRVAIGLSHSAGYSDAIDIDCTVQAKCLYFLHAMAGKKNIVGTIKLHFSDGSHQTEYIEQGNQIGSWFMPTERQKSRKITSKTWNKQYLLGWRGKNAAFENVGLYAYGLNINTPDKTITKISMESAENGNVWFVLGITASDKPRTFPDSDVSFGIPDCWGSAAVVYAIIEGIAGIKDIGAAYSKTLVSPRWASGKIRKAKATAKYEASGGYVSYIYEMSQDDTLCTLEIAGSSDENRLEILLPEDKKPVSAKVNGEKTEFGIKRIEQSVYVCIFIRGRDAKKIELVLR